MMICVSANCLEGVIFYQISPEKYFAQSPVEGGSRIAGNTDNHQKKFVYRRKCLASTHTELMHGGISH
jgi:hypothetical protein